MLQPISLFFRLLPLGSGQRVPELPGSPELRWSVAITRKLG